MASFVLFMMCAVQLVSVAKAVIANTSEATGTYNGITKNYGSSSAAVPVAVPNPAFTLSKIEKDITDTNGNSIRDPGDKVNYTFVVTNTGNVTINNITLTDAGTVVTGGPISLNPGAVDNLTFTATYTLTVADFVAGSHTNNATINGTAAIPAATAVSASSSVTTPLGYVASYSFVKTASLATTPPKANDTASYTLTVTNTGTSPLFNVSVSDPLLASNEKVNAHFVALLDSAQNAGPDELTTASLDETQQHSGIVEAAGRKFANSSPAPVLNSEFHADRQLVRMSGKTGPLLAGEKIGFVYALTNMGDGPVTSIQIAQPDSFAFGSALSLLNPNETDAASIIFTRDLTAADLAAGAVHSNGYVTWVDRGHEKMLQLVADVPLSTIKVYDQFATASISPVTVPQLDPGKSTVFTGPYVLKQTDIDAGTVHNIATATAQDIGGLTISHVATFDLPLPQAPAVGVVKAGTLVTALPGQPKAGDKITYKFSVTNLGNVTLNPATVADATPGVTVSGTQIANLAPGVTDSTSYTASYTLTQADVDAGTFQNQATATAKPPLTSAITAQSDPLDPKLHSPTVVALASKPAIGLVKSVSSIEDVNGNGRNDAGDKVHYLFTVYNLGNVTLHGITVVDKLGVPVVISGSPVVAPLAPGATDASATGIYVLTQADVDAGFVSNSATANGMAPDNTVVSHDSDPTVPTGNASTVQPLTQVPQVALFKKQSLWKDLNNDGLVDAGDELDYGFTVQNTGNVTLTNAKVTDLLAGVVLSGPSSGITLAPNALDSSSYTATYIIQPADETAAIVKNRARVDATQVGNVLSNSGDQTSSTPGTTDTVVQPAPKIGVVVLAPSYVDTNADGVVDAGDTLSYVVQVKNTGLVTLMGVTLVDANSNALLVPSGGPIASLSSGATDTTTFTATHIITAADLTLGLYNAQAKVSATANTSAGIKTINDLSDPSSFMQDLPTPFLMAATARIATLKTFSHYEDSVGTTIAAPFAGATAVYSVTVKNSGNVSLDTVTVAEKVGFNGTISGTTPFALAVGATDNTHFSAKHLLTDAEMLAGHFDNQLVATGTNTAKGLTATDDSDSSSLSGDSPTVVAVVANPQMALFKKQSLWKDLNGDGFVDSGDELDYSFVIQNTGNVTLTNLKLTDLLAGVVVSGPTAGISLAPAAVDSTSFTATYIIQPADDAAGIVKNRAKADSAQVNNVLSNSGDPISSTPGTTDTAVQPAPKIGAILSAPTYVDTNGDGIVDAGDTLTYAVQVKNIGLVPITGITLVDGNAGALLIPTGGPIGTLSPSATDTTTFTASHVITAADMVAGVYNAQAKINGSANTSSGVKPVTDLSDPTSFNQDGQTPYFITPKAQVAVLKIFDHFEDITGTTVASAATGNFAVYKVSLKNTGNINLDNVTIAEKAGFTGTIFGATPFALAVNAIDTTHFTVKHQLINAEMLAGHFDNQVVATGTNAAKGLTATDDSDAASFTANAPTVVNVTANAQAALFKKQTGTKDNNSDGLLDAGDEIDYIFTIQNLGNVALTNAKVTDLLPGASARPTTGITLQPGATDSTTFTGSYIVTVADQTAGVVKNSARLDSDQVSNITSRSGVPTSSVPGTTDSAITTTPTVAVDLLAPTYVDTNGDGVVDAGDTLTYPVQVKNTGTVSLTAISLADTNANGLLKFTGTFAGALSAGATDATTFTATHVLTPADVTAGAYNGQVKVSAKVSTGTLIVTDLSDPVDFTKDQPTPYVITPDAHIAALKIFDHFEDATGAAIVGPATNTYAVYKITVKNTGNVDFDNVGVAENVGFAGLVLGSTPFPLASGATDTSHFTAKHQITNVEMLQGHVDNQVVATGSSSAKGVSTTDVSDGSDFKGDAPTVTPVVANPQIAIVKTFKVKDVNGNGANDIGDIIQYSFTVANIGNVDLMNISINDANAVQPSPAPVIAALPVGAQDATTLTASHVITPAEVASGAYSNQAIVSAGFDPTHLTVNAQNPNGPAAQPFVTSNSDNTSLLATTKHPTVTPLSLARPVLTKTAARSQVKRGDVVAFKITALNLYGIQYQLVDIMPPGFGYAAGSATINGVATTPVINGQVLTFNSLTPPAGKLVLNLNLIASATLGGGKFANNARLIEQDNNNVLAVAQAVVEVIPDAVFDCSDIIGRVFDDLNADGYYQPGEPGIPAVRLVTANGVLITTDAQGRYHVPCAAIPDAAIGSNFILKVDPRTLPQGYKLTTGNALVVRLTRGKMTELNFGAGKHHEVRVDVTGNAFASDNTDLIPTWAKGVARLCKVLGKNNSDLVIFYHQGGETGELAQGRVDALEATIRQTCDPKHSLKIKKQVAEGK